eukprot:761871-Hanusia_phi.AAC.2
MSFGVTLYLSFGVTGTASSSTLSLHPCRQRTEASTEGRRRRWLHPVSCEIEIPVSTVSPPRPRPRRFLPPVRTLTARSQRDLLPPLTFSGQIADASQTFDETWIAGAVRRRDMQEDTSTPLHTDCQPRPPRLIPSPTQEATILRSGSMEL